MREKIVGGIYSALSAVMWVAIFSVLIFAVVLLCFGASKAPEVTVFSKPAVSAADPADGALAEHGKSGDNWYKIEAELKLSGNKYSPWTLEIEELGVKGREGFVVLPEEGLSFSRAEPQTAVLTVYVRWPAGQEDLESHLADVKLGYSEFYSVFGFMRFPWHNTPRQFAL